MAPLTAHLLGLQRFAGNQAVSAMLVAQRQDDDPRTKIKDALDKRDPALVAALVPDDLGPATEDERLQMIDVLNGSGGFTQQAKLPALWDSLGQVKSVATQNADRWKKSWQVAGGFMRESLNGRSEQKIFYLDVEDVGRGYLDQNEQYCKNELARLGLTETGEVPVGAPTEQQTKALQGLRDDAAKLAADQEALRDLRNVIVGYSSIELPPGGAGDPVQLGGPVQFDPDRPPAVGPQKFDANMKTWDDVKKEYDRLEGLIRARLMINPTLFPIARGAHEDPTKAKTIATGPAPDALSTAGKGLKEVLDNIARTRPMLSTLAPDLEEIQGQLLSGSKTSPGGADRNWKSSPYYSPIADDLVDQHKPGPWWQQIGLASAEMGAYVVAGLATGGAALAIGLAAKGVASTALAQGRAEALAAAASTNVTEETSLITDGQVDEAKAEVIESAAFALIDTVVAAGAVRSVLKGVLESAKVAAEEGAKATAEAEKWMAKEARKDARTAADSAKTSAGNARTAADKAKSAADGAGDAESARAQEAARKAAADADHADQAAKDLDALAGEAGPDNAGKAPPRTVGDHKLQIRGNWVSRCSPEPCMDLATGLAARAKAGVEALEGARLGDRAKELAARFLAIRGRASALAEQARTRLAGVVGSAKVAVENSLLDVGEPIEHEAQALELQIRLESMARGTLGKEWASLVRSSVKQRVESMRQLAKGAGAVDPRVARELKAFEDRAGAMARDAERLEARPGSFGKPRSEVETDLSIKWKELDKALDGTLREQYARAAAREAGGATLGETDADVRRSLGIAPGEKAPDIGRDLGGGRMLLAESKGTDIDGALAQLRNGANSPAAAGKTLVLQIYVPAVDFEVMTRTLDVGGHAVTRRGAGWFLTNPGIGGWDVQILTA
jgi:hypothetical protein